MIVAEKVPDMPIDHEGIVDLEFERITRDTSPDVVFQGAWWHAEDESWCMAGRWFETVDEGADEEAGLLNAWQKSKLLLAAAEKSAHEWPEELAKMDPDLLYNSTCKVARVGFPGFDVRFKDENILHRLIGLAVPSYASRASTWGDVVYLPRRPKEDEAPDWRALQHEVVHVWDGQTLLGLVPPQWSWARFVTIPLFMLGWWLPQILALAVAHAVWLGLLSPLVLLLVAAGLFIPSPVRIASERRAARRTLELWPWEEREERARALAASMPVLGRPSAPQLLQPSPYAEALNSWLSFREEDADEGS